MNNYLFSGSIESDIFLAVAALTILSEVVSTLWEKPTLGHLSDHWSGPIFAISSALGVFGAFRALNAFPAWHLPGPPNVWTLVGTLFVVTGLILRRWAIHTLGKFFNRIVIIHVDHQLIQSGPYKYLAHPSYTGMYLGFLGLGFALGNAMSLLAVALLPLYGLVYRIHVEEDALANNFGPQFATYLAKRKRLVPFLW